MAQKNAGGNSLVTLGLLAVAGYFVYEWFIAPASSSASAASAPAAPAPAAGSAVAASSVPAASAASADSSVSSPSRQSPSGPVPGRSSPGVTTGLQQSTGDSGASLDQVYRAILTQAAPDPNFTGSGSNLTGSAYHFNVYLQLAAPHLQLPDMALLFGGVDGASQPMTAAAWWAKVAPALQAANAGLSGLGLYGLAGAFFSGARG